VSEAYIFVRRVDIHGRIELFVSVAEVVNLEPELALLPPALLLGVPDSTYLQLKQM